MELKNQQKPLSVPEQVENLKNLGLVIEREIEAEDLLNHISYFRLIKAYSLGLKPKNGKYYDNITLDQIVQLYRFNEELRHSMFQIIETIEVTLRCRISNHFSVKHGVLGYNDSNNFENEEYHSEFKADIDEEVKRNLKSPFVRNFKNNYVDGEIPFYALIELFSFGMLSKFYRNMLPEDKKEIALTYNVGYTYLESWFENIAYVRNICAHYGRLYNAKLAKKPNLYKQYAENGIRNDRVFATLLCIKHIIPEDRWKTFIEGIKIIIQKYPMVKIETMGFPEDWEQIV